MNENTNFASIIATIIMILAVVVAAYIVVGLVGLLMPLIKLALLGGLLYVGYRVVRNLTRS